MPRLKDAKIRNYKQNNLTMLNITNPNTINDIIAKVVIKTLPTISGDPDQESINEMIQALYANAATLPTIMAGGKHGHIGLMMKDTMYVTLEMVTQW